MKGLLHTITGFGARRPRLVLAVAVALVLGAAVLALRLQPTAATNSFVSGSSASYKDTQRFYRSFGEEPIEVLVQGNLQQLVLSDDIERLLGLEGCLSGNVPTAGLPAEGGVDGPCGQIARLHSVKVVLGPGTFISEAASRIDEILQQESEIAQHAAKQAEEGVAKDAREHGKSTAEAEALGKEAAKVTIGRFEENVATLALQYGLTSKPSLENSNFVSTLVFDPSKPAGTPKQRFAYLFPSRNIALVSLRMRAGLTQSQRNRTIALVRAAIAMPQWHLTHGEHYSVTGEPVIVTDLTGSITSSIKLLLIAVLLVMAATLGLLFGGRPRLLPLVLATGAAALTFGALSLAGSSLTVASIAVLPVLVGLAVDYAIQFQSRVGEAADMQRAAGREPVARISIQHAAAVGAPAIVTAAAASAAGMLVLLLSPVPMVRGFGVLLVIGVALALLCTLLAGAAALSIVPAPAPVPVRRRSVSGALTVPAGLSGAWRGASELLRENPLTRALVRFALVGATARPGRVLCVGLVLAAAGWGLDTQTKVETDITKLVPQSLGSLQALQQLESSTGVGGEIAVLISGRNVASPATIEWMSAYQSTMLARFGYSSSRGCGQARLCPAFSLPDLFGNPAAASTTRKTKLTTAEVNGLLKAIPPYFSQDVIAPSHRTATLAFGIRLMSLSSQQQLVEAMRSGLHPPAGVSAQLVGLPVLAAQSGSEVADPWRRLETLIVGLAAVALVLMIAFRGDRRRALVPLAPIVLATGWSALILFAVRIPLNPMSVTLGALVIAISTEFSVLLSERHRQERLAGYDTIEALRRSYRRTGAAVAASGVTAIAGFGVLALSDIRMLRDFGLVTLIDLSVSLIGVLVALPATLVLAERSNLRAGAPREADTGGPRRGKGRLRPRLRVRRAGGIGSGHEPA
jgi:hydrophobe/amphiphile efflux-3 (HAE3) family protein